MQVGLLNVDGYYNSLLAFMDKAVEEGFVTPAARHIIVSAQTAQDLMCKLEVPIIITLSIIIIYTICNFFHFNSTCSQHFLHSNYSTIICTWLGQHDCICTTVYPNYWKRSEPFIWLQEYVPEHCGVAPKLSWEMEQQLVNTAKSDISRWLKLN